MVVALLAVLKAGGAYLPLDPAYPEGSPGFMLADSQARVLLTQSNLLTDLTEDVQRVCLDDRLGAVCRGESTDNPSARKHGGKSRLRHLHIGFDRTAQGCDDFTSQRCQLLRRHRPVFSTGGDGDTWLAVTSISFDISVLELLWTLTRGFKVVIQSEAETTHCEHAIRHCQSETQYSYRKATTEDRLQSLLLCE